MNVIDKQIELVDIVPKKNVYEIWHAGHVIREK